MASRSEKLRRRQHRKEKKRQWAERSGLDAVRPENLFVVNPPGATKMSEVLLELVRPELVECESEPAMRTLLTLGMAAWNAALMQGAQRTAMLEELALAVPVELRRDFLNSIEPFIRRKEELFPHIRRPILSFELTRLPSGDPYITVVSGLC